MVAVFPSFANCEREKQDVRDRPTREDTPSDPSRFSRKSRESRANNEIRFTRYVRVPLWTWSLCQKRLRADGAKRRCRVIRAGVYLWGWQGRDKICDSFTVSLTEPKKLYSEVTVFTPANHRYFHRQGDWLLSNSNLQCEVSSCIQRDVAAHPATSGREVE